MNMSRRPAPRTFCQGTSARTEAIPARTTKRSRQRGIIVAVLCELWDAVQTHKAPQSKDRRIVALTASARGGQDRMGSGKSRRAAERHAVWLARTTEAKGIVLLRPRMLPPGT